MGWEGKGWRKEMGPGVKWWGWCRGRAADEWLAVILYMPDVACWRQHTAATCSCDMLKG